MEANTKKIIGTLAIAGAAVGGFYLLKKGKKIFSAAKMSFALLGFRVHKLNLQELQFAVQLRCYNPTQEPIQLAVHQVVAKYKGSPIAFSTPNLQGIKVKEGSYRQPEIHFQVPYMNLMGKGLSLATLQNTEQLKANLSFTLTIAINGETITTTQKLTDNMSGLGQLGIVSGPRDTKNGTRYNNLIKKPTGKEVFLKTGNVYETVENCIDIVAGHYHEVEGLAKELKAESLKDTCRNIFNFAYNYLQYKLDKKGTEQLRTPARSWHDGQVLYMQKGDKSSGIDCDDFSIFCGSLLKCLGIPFKFRITKYDGKANFQHIYVFVPDSEDEIIIDPVLSKFDYQKPYSFEKSDFNMKPVQLAGIHGIDGMEGTTGFGLPISVLSGVDLNNTLDKEDDFQELMGIISGIDFEETINGLGNPEDATLRYLIRTRDFLLKNKANKNRMAHIQNPDQFISMLDQAIKFWNTPDRDNVLDKLIAIEDKLAESGFIKYDADAIQGLDEFDDLEDEIEGLYEDEEYDDLSGRRSRRRARRRKRKAKRKKRRARFFKSVKRVGKKVVKGGVKLAKKYVKAVIRFNPLTIAIRGGLLAAFRINLFGMAKNLQYAYLPDNMAGKYNIDPAKLKKLKKVHGKVKKLFKGLQGKEHNLRKAILKGAKQRSNDFSLKGNSVGLLAEIQGLEALGELAELGDLGAVATATSVTAASGVIATIKKWLGPVKNVFAKAASKRKERREKQGKTVSEKLKQRAAQYTPPPVASQTQFNIPQETPPQEEQQFESYTSEYTPEQDASQQAPFIQQQIPNSMARTPTPPNKKGLSKKAKIGIAIGGAAILGTGLYLAFRKKEDNEEKAKPGKKSLGSITLR